MWRAADPTVPEGLSDTAAAAQLSAFLLHMPAVEVFGVVCEVGRATEFYPFTNAFYESLAYSKYRKRHFSDDLILPRTMGDLAGADGGDPRRNTVLWDSRYISNSDVDREGRYDAVGEERVEKR